MKSKKVVLIALVAILMWSTSGTAFKLALKNVSYSQLLFIAANTAWITLAILIAIRRIRIDLNIKNILKSALNGFLNPFLYYLILLKAYTLLPAQIAQPLNYTWPVILILLSVIFLRQKIKWFDITAVFISFTGVVVISLMGEKSFSQDKASLLGIILATGSSLVWASYWILNVKDKRGDLEKLFLNFLFGAIFITIYLSVKDEIPKLSTNWAPAIYVGITEMAIAFVFWLTAMNRSGNNSRIGNLVFISPFLALIFIHLILGEQIYWTTLLGLFLIISGIFFQQLMARNGSGK